MSARLLPLACGAALAVLIGVHFFGSPTSAPAPSVAGNGPQKHPWAAPPPASSAALPLATPSPATPAAGNPLAGLMDRLNLDTATYVRGEMAMLTELEGALAQRLGQLLGSR